MVYYKNVAAPCFTVKDVRSRFGSAKYTDSCKKACEWVQACIDKYEAVVEEEEGRADTSFASEALNESDPNYQTRMVT